MHIALGLFFKGATQFMRETGTSSTDWIIYNTKLAQYRPLIEYVFIYAVGTNAMPKWITGVRVLESVLRVNYLGLEQHAAGQRDSMNSRDEPIVIGA
jgi:hypothetical protein